MLKILIYIYKNVVPELVKLRETLLNLMLIKYNLPQNQSYGCSLLPYKPL